jgi:hypothetical protein
MNEDELHFRATTQRSKIVPLATCQSHRIMGATIKNVACMPS